MSGTSDQKMPIDNKSDLSFYTDDNKFRYRNICVSPTKIFTSTFAKINLIKENTVRIMTRTRYNQTVIDDITLIQYALLHEYFSNDASEKYILILDKSEWKFWFIHVITQLRRLQTSPLWKKDGKIDRNDKFMLCVCFRIFFLSYTWKLSEKSFRVPKEFFYELASCIDTLTPRLPQSDFVHRALDICVYYIYSSENTT